MSKIEINNPLNRAMFKVFLTQFIQIKFFKEEKDFKESLDNLKRVCDMIKYSVFNLDIPTFSYKFDISFIPQYFEQKKN